MVNLVNVGPKNISWPRRTNSKQMKFSSDEEPGIGLNIMVSEMLVRNKQQTKQMKKCLADLFNSLEPIGFHIFIDPNYFEKRILQCNAEKVLVGWVKEGDVLFDAKDCGGQDKPRYFVRNIQHTFGRLGWLIF